MIPFKVLNITHMEPSNKLLIPAIEELPQLELKALLNHWRYASLNQSNSTLTIVVSNYSCKEEEERHLKWWGSTRKL